MGRTVAPSIKKLAVNLPKRDWINSYCTTLEDRIFVCGGLDESFEDKNTSCFSLDWEASDLQIESSTYYNHHHWFQFVPFYGMQTHFRLGDIVAMKDKLLIAGAIMTSYPNWNRPAFAPIEIYSMSSSTWSARIFLPIVLSYFSLTVSEDFVFLSGGQDQQCMYDAYSSFTFNIDPCNQK